MKNVEHTQTHTQTHTHTHTHGQTHRLRLAGCGADERGVVVEGRCPALQPIDRLGREHWGAEPVHVYETNAKGNAFRQLCAHKFEQRRRGGGSGGRGVVVSVHVCRM